MCECVALCCIYPLCTDLRAVLERVRGGGRHDMDDAGLDLFADLVATETQQLAVVLLRERLVVDCGPVLPAPQKSSTVRSSASVVVG